MSDRLRIAALMAAGALGLHQLRYLVAHGDGASAALAREGHAYLGALAPAVAVLLGGAALEFLLRLAARRSAGEQGYRFLAVTAILLVVYVGQESLEALLTAGHPTGLAAVLGSGGWLALPLACLVGLGITLLLRGADRALAAAARRRDVPAGRIPPSRPATPLHLRPLAPLACNRAGRGPPRHLLD